ncbi:MAG: tetratricopeptide repeat protein [Acidobacteriia bacterium]|nr:tetratricopeptide repeat protein [Terriglobia bacterium]
MNGDAGRWGRIAVWAGWRLLALLVVCAGGVRAQEEGNIAGQIVLENAQMADVRMDVVLEGRGSIVSRTVSDNEGKFEFLQLPANTYYVVVEAEGYQPVRMTAAVNPTVIPTTYVRVMLRRKALERAAEEARWGSVDVAELEKKYPPEVRKEYEAGQKAEARGENAAAMGHYEAALRIAPGFYPARTSLGYRKMQQGDFSGAEEEFRRVLEASGRNAEASIFLGNVLYLTHRDEEARKALEAGLRLAPFSALGHCLNGQVLARLGEKALAERELKAAREFDPRMPQAAMALGTFYLQAGRQSEAVAVFEAFLKQFPKDPAAAKVREALARLKQTDKP